jgi:hypothetical protein
MEWYKDPENLLLIETALERYQKHLGENTGTSAYENLERKTNKVRISVKASREEIQSGSITSAST